MHLTQAEHMAGLQRVLDAMPTTKHRLDKLATDRLCQQLIERDGETWESLEQRARGYADHCNTGGASGPQYVMPAQTFFSDDDRNGPWRTDYKPLASPAEVARAEARQREADSLQRVKDSRATLGLPNFRDPLPGETASQYDTALRLERNSRPLPLGAPRFPELFAAKTVTK